MDACQIIHSSFCLPLKKAVKVRTSILSGQPNAWPYWHRKNEHP
jgi:hypothetical protein